MAYPLNGKPEWGVNAEATTVDIGTILKRI